MKHAIVIKDFPIKRKNIVLKKNTQLIYIDEDFEGKCTPHYATKHNYPIMLKANFVESNKEYFLVINPMEEILKKYCTLIEEGHKNENTYYFKFLLFELVDNYVSMEMWSNDSEESIIFKTSKKLEMFFKSLE